LLNDGDGHDGGVDQHGKTVADMLPSETATNYGTEGRYTQR
jgi:hypothetical protein